MCVVLARCCKTQFSAMSKTVLALITAIAGVLLVTPSVSAWRGEMSFIGKPVAQSLIVQTQMNDEAKRCSKQCRRQTGMNRTKCYCECSGGFWWYPMAHAGSRRIGLDATKARTNSWPLSYHSAKCRSMRSIA